MHVNHSGKIALWIASLFVISTPFVRAQMADPAPRSEQAIDWAVGEIRADPLLNLVYLLDVSGHRILALNTSSGNVDATVTVPHSIRGGYIEFSVDGTKLHVSTPDTNGIFTFETGTLAPIGSIEVPYSVGSFAVGSDGFFYTAGRKESNFSLIRIHPVTGSITGESSIPSSSGSLFLSRNASGSSIFVTSSDYTAAYGSTREFAVVGDQMPSPVSVHFPDSTSERGVILDEGLNRLYRATSSGVGIWNLSSGTYTSWPNSLTGNASVAYFPGSNAVWGAFGTSSAGEIRRFNRSDGTVVHTYPNSSIAGYFDAQVVRRGLETTANGHVFYVKRNLEGQFCVGLIGHAAVSLPTAVPENLKPHSENKVLWRVGDMTGDPARNSVYIVDETNQKLIAFNTGTGSADADIDLPVDPSGGKLALSPNGSTLYLSTPLSQRVLSFTVGPLLTLTENIQLTIPLTSFVEGSDGHLYGIHDGDLYKIDPELGEVSGTLNNVAYTFGGLIRRDEMGTRLYLMDQGLSSGAGGIADYRVQTGHMPTYAGTRFTSKSNDRDLSVDLGRNRLFRASGGVYGIGVWDLENGIGNFWPFGSPYGSAVAQHPDLPTVFGASWSELVHEFDKDSAKILGTYDLTDFPTGYNNARIINDRLEVGANGVAIYARTNIPGDHYVGAIGLESISLPRKFTIPPPTAVTGVSATDGTLVNQVRIVWNYSETAEYYSIFRSNTNDSGTASEIGARVTATSYFDNTAVPATTYYYWVRAENEGGVSDFGSADLGSAREAPPIPPASISATDGGHDNRIVLNWSPVPGADQYRVYSAVNAVGPYTLRSSPLANVTTYNDTSAARGIIYHYRVASFTFGGGASVPSQSVSGFRQILAPTNLAASDGQYQGETHLTWQAVGGASIYKIYRGTQPSGLVALHIGSSGLSNFIDNTGEAGIEYFYFIAARVGSVDSDLGDAESGYGTVTPPFRPDVLIGISPSSLKGGQIYAKGPAQEIRQVSKKLKLLRWYLKTENDGETDDMLRVQLTPGNRLFSNNLRTGRGENITGAAITASHVLSLESGSSENYLLDVKPSKKLRKKAKRKSFDFSLRSLSGSLATDVATARAQTSKK